MKVTFLLSDGIKQLALMPENKTERDLVNLFGVSSVVTAYRGAYYAECNGGWAKEYVDNDGLILVMRDDVK